MLDNGSQFEGMTLIQSERALSLSKRGGEALLETNLGTRVFENAETAQLTSKVPCGKFTLDLQWDD